jgi:hypothetical protein
MREDCWAGGQEYWTVGSNGLVYASDPTAGPAQQWGQFVPPGQEYRDFKNNSFEGVSFSGVNDGIFVGQITVGTTVEAVAYHYHRTVSGTTWTPITLPVGHKIQILSDVAFDGSSIYAVGQRVTETVYEGVVLKATFSGGVASAFTEVQQVPPCTVGIAADGVPVLSEVEIDPSGDIWLGGQCGRLWRSTNGLTWVGPMKSQTDAHVQGMSFPVAGTGFVAGYRASETQQSVIRVTVP